MKLTLIVTIILLSFLGCQKKEKEAMVKSHQDFDSLLENYYEERLKFFPLDATSHGDNRYNDQLPNNISQEYRENLRTFYKEYLQHLNALDTSAFSDQQQISLDVLKRETTIGLEGLEFNEHFMPVHQFWGLPLSLPQYGSGESIQPFKTVKDYRDFLGRIHGFVSWTDTAILNMRKGLLSGETFPKVLMEKVLPQLQAIAVDDVTKSIFYKPIDNLPDSFSREDKQNLTEAYKKAIKEEVIPSYKKLHDFIKTEYIPKTRASSGFSDIPLGKERYQYLIKYWTTTDLSPEEIYETGLKEVARIRAEMEKVKAQVGFKGNLLEFFNYVNTDKKFMPFTKDEEVISAFVAIEEKMKPKLSSLFNQTPKTKFEVRQTEKFREASASAEYMEGAPDGSRPGIFYVPVIDPKAFNYTGMETLFLHEAIPGHHYQISLQQENESLPKFRRFLWYGAYGEGWALYTESLGKELGLYTDPYQYFGNLGDEIHRAIRLVVDVGLHTKGWSREKAIEYMMENEAIAEEGAVAEIERYMAIPGQALSYKIGQLKIIELRKRAEQALGSKFKISEFHDIVLKNGCLPLEVLENRINQWINSH